MRHNLSTSYLPVNKAERHLRRNNNAGRLVYNGSRLNSRIYLPLLSPYYVETITTPSLSEYNERYANNNHPHASDWPTDKGAVVMTDDDAASRQSGSRRQQLLTN